MNCRRLPGAESAAARQVPPAALQQISTPCALVCKLCLACRGSNMTGLWAVVKNSCGAVCESCQGTSSPGNKQAVRSRSERPQWESMLGCRGRACIAMMGRAQNTGSGLQEDLLTMRNKGG